MQNNGDKNLDILGFTEIYFSEENGCIEITHKTVTIENNLPRNQEEVDANVALHSKHAFERFPEKVIIVWSHSGEIDIIIIILGISIDQPEYFFMDSGRGKFAKDFY